ncbi:amidohydrolase family protein [Sphingomonas canadensis]|uniref:Amidohydrolase family protein n=1 Tax=Sphingomonas canadensis TaxID=1219257 RepID=A0ABW3H1T9_9SPHN|nr:amidohydrolase [Sphingomonas canadensis]
MKWICVVATMMAAPALAKGSPPYTGPIIDVHAHVAPADGNGPAPNMICPGAAANLRYDGTQPWGAVFMGMLQHPRCKTPIKGPATDAEVRDQTIATLRRRNAIAVLSGSPQDVAAWMKMAPGLFLPGIDFGLRSNTETPDDIAAMHAAGRLAVFGEVMNQYQGVLADDAAFEPYWAMAEANDIPVGLHLGFGPPGAPALIPAYRIQSPRQIEPVLARHPKLRVYLMHAGAPFIDELKAMLYAYPQLYVDTAVLQMAMTRKGYYRFLEDLIDAGFEDRIMFGSDQMNWPGLIDEGIDAINNAPFLSLEQKKAILYDNAKRFLRLK